MPEGQPFLISPSAEYDVALNRYFSVPHLGTPETVVPLRPAPLPLGSLVTRTNTADEPAVGGDGQRLKPSCIYRE